MAKRCRECGEPVLRAGLYASAAYCRKCRAFVPGERDE